METHLTAWRKYRRLTQAALADMIDMTPTALSRIENGAPTSFAALAAIANALKCEIVDLLVRDPEDPDILGVWKKIPLYRRPAALELLSVFAGGAAEPSA